MNFDGISKKIWLSWNSKIFGIAKFKCYLNMSKFKVVVISKEEIIRLYNERTYVIEFIIRI